MRIELKGKGTSIPVFGLPSFSAEGDLPTQTFLLENGVPFVKTDYVSLGYTHYEVMCVGAVGGKGGDNPSPYRYSQGGGGGGGGLMAAAGLLADLPESTPVVVGQPGADGRDVDAFDYVAGRKEYTWFRVALRANGSGEAVVDSGARPLVVDGVTYITAAGAMVAPYVMTDERGNIVPANYPYTTWDAAHPERIPKVGYVMYPNTSYVQPLDGADGGYSSFGTICKASGGKGGKKTPDYATYNYQYGGIANRPGGAGGQGGMGGTLVAGGGGAGGYTEEVYSPGFPAEPTSFNAIAPVDGTWDGTIGKGGGGGRGGLYRKPTTNLEGWENSAGVTHLAQNGAQGAFNFADTTRYGPGQNRSVDSIYGINVIPGSGGGAKLSPVAIYGSRAAGANPQGVVWLRLVQITS